MRKKTLDAILRRQQEEKELEEKNKLRQSKKKKVYQHPYLPKGFPYDEYFNQEHLTSIINE